MPRYRVRIAGKHYDAMADLVRKHRLNIAGHTGKKAGRSRYIVDAFADSDQIEQLKSEGYSVDVREDVDEAGKKRQSEIRSLTTREPIRNVAAANHYLNVPDSENSLAAITCSPPKRFVIITRQIKATEPKKIVTESRRFSTAAVIASNKGRTPTYIAGPMLLEYPQ